jgi:hypothetical protein
LQRRRHKSDTNAGGYQAHHGLHLRFERDPGTETGLRIHADNLIVKARCELPRKQNELVLRERAQRNVTAARQPVRFRQCYHPRLSKDGLDHKAMLFERAAQKAHLNMTIAQLFHLPRDRHLVQRQMHLFIALAKNADHVWKYTVKRGGDETQSEAAGFATRSTLGGLNGQRSLGQSRSRVLQKHRSGLGQADAAPGALE